MTAHLTAGGALALLVITALLALTGGDPASPLRHLYLVPVVAGALRGGALVGALGAGAALLLYAPFVLREIERSGLTPEALEGLVTLGIVVGVATLGGILTTRARRQRERYETILTVQRVLATEAPLEEALGVLRRGLACRLGAGELALAVDDGERMLVAGGEPIAADSLGARVLEHGMSAFVRDAGGGRRPRRVFVTPLSARGRPIGVLALERSGELPADERAALEVLGVHVGLALENARLAACQRRFAEELAQKVAAATRRLEELDRAKSSFVAVASHELRTPLTALQGFSELLAMRRLPAEEVHRLAGIMRGEAKRLGRIVSDLLDLSRIERGLPPALHRAPVAVEAALAATADVFRRGSATHTIVVECAEPLPCVDADPDALERILTNLISNAMKYSAPGRTLWVRARRANDATVEFEIADEGMGIPADALARIFEPYYRAPSADGTARGTGIGLAVVKSLVEAHGGAVSVESAADVGTRVTFSLPTVS